MDLMFKTEALSIDKFNKCGELYRSPIVGEKQYIFLSCIYCKDMSWELDTFLKHLNNVHQAIDEIFININTQNETEANPTISSESGNKISPMPENCQNDPLDEKHYDFYEALPGGIKIENSESYKFNKVNTKTDDAINLNGIFNGNNYEYNTDNGIDEEYEPDVSTATENENDEYITEECDEDDISNDDADDITFESEHDDDDNKKISLKRFTKNRDFIKAIIIAYQKQNILWEKSDESKKGTTPEEQEAFQIILNDINQKFKVKATQKQIERVIKRLKLRFAHYLRLKDKGVSNKPLWFSELLSFLEIDFKGNKLKSNTLKRLYDNQLIALINLLRENECFWNENNIYHTSVINKQEILNTITGAFSKMFDLKDFNVDVMQSSIDEIMEMAREENANKIKQLKCYENYEYKSSNKLYKEIQFLLPHVGPFECKYCSKSFNDIYAYKFHISRHEGTKPFKCMQCPRELTHKKDFIYHLRRHTKECPFLCNSCDKSFPTQKEWHRHVIKHGSKPYVCEICADSFYTQHQLTNHMKNHNNIRDHICTECGKGFTHRGLLRQHLQTHNKTKCFCTLCDNIYSNPRSLRKHYVRVHESRQQQSAACKTQYNCQICKITFSTIHDAKQHRKEHKESNPSERKHVCDICSRHFAYPRNLADHKKTHSNIRDQVCDVCGKAFTNANLLKQHKNVHTDEKFMCKACGKDYAHYRGLYRHIGKVHGTNIRDLDALLENQKLSSSLE